MYYVPWDKISILPPNKAQKTKGMDLKGLIYCFVPFEDDYYFTPKLEFDLANRGPEVDANSFSKFYSRVKPGKYYLFPCHLRPANAWA